ncbi:uncharacterized protein LOC123304848 [Chrysoperla carnea]|uniref:uncharacterized protein LOC123304848 n=1 Tax=Chrysoperla carnea TaxID=189513 RepID=UPI001D07B8DE|nr:uncharacterized protein LOC123304848 [Chrysoperla carnea]
MQSSLDTLVKNLDDNQFEILKEEFEASHPHLNLLKEKGIFPYDYVTEWNQLNETVLPEPDSFFNQLTDSNISKEEYEHAKNVWEKFHIKNLGEYADIYLKCDVLLLACVFENFRKICHSTYGLDPASYYTTPGLTFDAMLKVTKVKLELITDINILNFVEACIRGGLTLAIKRYAESNNPYMMDYDSNLPESYIIYLDCNNLYGLAMIGKLAKGEYKFLTPQEVQSFDVNIDSDGDYGYMLEVSIDYPEKLHDFHNDFPFLPEHKIVNKQKKLVSTFYSKHKYILHLKNLQQALNYGLKLTARHRILRFSQSLWLKKYIDLNTEKRTNAKNSFEKDFFKLMNNAMFGKTMESVRKRSNCKLITRYEGKNGVRNLISSPYCKKFTVIAENLLVIELQPSELKFDKPIIVGACVLELSNFHSIRSSV